ncbi:MAG: AMP-binding protein [Candidatus Aminicenantes bacterium]
MKEISVFKEQVVKKMRHLNLKGSVDAAVVAATQKNKEKEYWLKKLTGELEKSCFFYDFKAREVNGRTMKSMSFAAENDLFSRLMQLRNQSDQRLHMILTAGVVLLLSKYTGSSDVIVGAPVLKQQEQTNARFINTVLVLRNRLEQKMTFKELLQQVRETVTEAARHQNYPLEVLLEQLNLTVNESEGEFPLFDVAVLLENIHDPSYIRHTRPNIVFSFHRTADRVRGILQYRSQLYERATIERIVDHFLHLLSTVLFNVDIPLGEVELLSREEKKKILLDFNATEGDYPAHKTVQQLFAEQVVRTPDAAALIAPRAQHPDTGSGNLQVLSYRQLNEAANHLARVLRQRGIRPGVIAALVFYPSVDMVIAIMALLKSGGAYLAIDPDYPTERIIAILNDCQAAIVLTHSFIVEGEYSFTAFQGIRSVQLKPYLTAKRASITNLDGLPVPDRTLVDYERYARYIGQGMIKNTYINLLTTRGCPFNCTYCHKIWPRKHVARSAENIFTEVQIFYRMGVRRFVIIDDIFNFDVKNSTRFFELIIENKLEVQLFFSGGLRGDILTREYIDLMVKAGTVSLALALETASPRLQKLINKNLDIERFRENIDYFCQQYPQVIIELFTIHGFPTETEEEAMKTLDFIKSLKWVHMPYLNILRIYSKTDMETFAIKNGISRRDIFEAENLAFYELPEILPFDKSFTAKVQSDFLNEYFLDRERLLHVLPYQLKIFTETEIVQKYDSYLPMDINSFDELLDFINITKEELNFQGFLDEDYMLVPGLNQKMRSYFPERKPEPGAFRVLLLDLSQYFSEGDTLLYDMFEPPLGLMYLLTYLYRELGSKVDGRIYKSRVDFDNYDQLKSLLEEFKPDLVGIRTLTLYKDFFHKSVALIRQWGVDVPIVAGGPYGSSGYENILQDKHVDLVVLGEGEVTFSQLVKKCLENRGKLPGEEVLKEIPGLAFIPNRKERTKAHVFARDILMLDQLRGARPGEPVGNPKPVNNSGDLAYIIYTSGSTGEPKGIMENHDAFVDFVTWAGEEFEHRPGYQVLLSNSYASAGAIQQIFPPLVTGGTLHLIHSQQRKDIKYYVNYLRENRINNIDEVPVILHALFDTLDLDENRELLPDLTCLSVGSEYIPIELIRKCKKYLNHHGLIINAYGQAEAASETCTYRFDGRSETERSLIGKPRRNLKVYILNSHGDICPLGVPGELWVSGIGIARGYINKSELTCEKFKIINYEINQKLLWGVQGGGFLEKSPPGRRRQKIYNTGDFVRWLPDGNIEFLGRKDHQVQVRGFRVELGEIERHLRQHPQIDDTVVVAGEGQKGETFLRAYFVAREELFTADIRGVLKKKLPEYMIPSHFIRLDRIPLNPNGKVDRNALPDYDEYAPVLDTVYVSPESDLEKTIADTWKEMLQVDRVGIYDNFFEIGGHSLNIIQVNSKLNRLLETNIPVVMMFRYPTIHALTEYLNQGSGDEETGAGTMEDMESLDNRIDVLEQGLQIFGEAADE